MFTTCESVSVVVDGDPDTYVPTMPVSDHLEFVSPTFNGAIICQIESLKSLLSENPPTEVATWLTAKLDSLQQTVQQAKDDAHRINARLLAERVVHKFKKWGPVRFGRTPRCQRCFYTGQTAIDSQDNPLTFDKVFEDQLRELAGADADQILANLHIGPTSAKRFCNFIHVKEEVDLSSSSEDELPELVSLSDDDE